jgi:hypothetical protein
MPLYDNVRRSILTFQALTISMFSRSIFILSLATLALYAVQTSSTPTLLPGIAALLYSLAAP